MRHWIQVIGNVLVTLGIMVAIFSDAAFLQKLPVWDQITSALHRTINNGEPLTKENKGFQEMSILLSEENESIRKMNIEEIRWQSTFGPMLTERGLITVNNFEIKGEGGMKEEISVRNIESKSFDFFIRDPLIKISFGLFVSGLLG